MKVIKSIVASVAVLGLAACSKGDLYDANQILTSLGTSLPISSVSALVVRAIRLLQSWLQDLNSELRMRKCQIIPMS